VAGWILLLLAGISLGYVRLVDSNTVPDTRAGVLELTGGSAQFRSEPVIRETTRLAFRKTEPLDGDVRVRLRGELRARMPVLSAGGLPELDADGRWRFHEVALPQISDIITIGQNDPVGTEYIIPQPFNSLDRVEVLDGGKSSDINGRVELYRVSNHISSFVREGRGQTPVTVLGRITRDPWVYSFKTVLTITPWFIQYRPGGPFYLSDGGDIRVTVDPEIPDYERIATSSAYGSDVFVQGQLLSARGMANEGGFDQNRYLHNHNVYGQMSLRSHPGAATPILLMKPLGGEQGTGNKLVEYSLRLRDCMLLTIKMTMPYPNSAMLGAISLGLRYGLQNTECILSDRDGNEFIRSVFAASKGCENHISQEFRHAGVSHVLAVSGLHVTIITAMFLGIFTLMRISKRVYVPFIILALVVFAIITGARPSTLRAVIMNSLFLLTWGYLGQGLQASLLLGIPVAAFLILLQNPAMIVDPSFTLSFGAILSLGLMTPPCQNILTRFRGNDFAVLILVVAGLIWAVLAKWLLLTTWRFWIPFALVTGWLFWLGRALSRRGVHLIGEKGFEDLPAPVSTFISAQVAIQLGMMVPLSAYYFHRWPVAGVFTNLLAIPLIGIVLQIGMIAGLLSFIPGVGIFLALLLNGANWLLSSGFLLLAHYASAWFPWPFVRQPSLARLIAYYIACAVFIWHRPLWQWSRNLWQSAAPRRRVVCGVVMAVVLGLWCFAVAWTPARRAGLNMTVLSVRYGSSILIETPAGRNILVDAGFVEHTRGRNNTAERTILTYLSTRRILHLDALILTGPRPERAGGAASIVQHCRVDNLFTTGALEGLSVNESFGAFAERLNGGDASLTAVPGWYRQSFNELIGNAEFPNRRALAGVMAKRGPTLLNRWADCVLRRRALKAGDVLFREEVDGNRFQIEVLSAGADAGDDNPADNGALVLRVVFGDTAIMLPGDLHYAGQQRLGQALDADQLRADVMLVPQHGTAIPAGSARNLKSGILDSLRYKAYSFYQKVAAQCAILEFGNPRPVLGRGGRDAVSASEITRRFFTDELAVERFLSTDSDMAIYIHSDGNACTVDTQARRVSQTASDSDAVTDLERAW